MKSLAFLFIYVLNIYALDFKVASYNVENFFDLHYDKTEYKEFIPNTKSWDKTSFQNKLENISKVIKDLDADILALQEIESQRVFDAIVLKNPQYKFHKFTKNNHAAIGLAILSKFPIINKKNIVVDKYDKYSRDILKVTITIENKPLIVYINHWRSKRAKESQRIKYAYALKNEIITLDDTADYIILGDLNSNYNEFQTFKYDKKLNDTYNITGINQILNTTINENFVKKFNILNYDTLVHFNTWLELPNKERFSSKFRNQNVTPDNILLSVSLFDDKNISYINGSFNVFHASYLYKNNRIYRWNFHKKNGYSDHLPIYAFFSTNKQKSIQKKPIIENTHKGMISKLYTVQQISDYKINDVTVIYKSKKLAIIKQTDTDRAVMLYKPSSQLKLGFVYDMTVDKIDLYFGLKEITSISNIKLKKANKHFKDLYLDGNNIDLDDENLVNNIVYNIKGIYKKRYLYFNDSKIKLYFPKGIKKPKEGENISISSGHLSIYKSSIQIVLHKKNDFTVY
ncbi:MAG: hypothetical protein ACI81I_000504 [Arcobacteraceae bacterium]|jgi:hypothetical protein